ncbi:efflux RND transporter periplasmic adaptor subunit [Brevundimonas sp. GCM10030266]|uniref:efflux RND transporter periplasmic adaptor subunit n=1 Tax=Brevundimonas sp. GCM10030266 TaxID=3273386 RepID=UPI003619B900
MNRTAAHRFRLPIGWPLPPRRPRTWWIASAAVVGLGLAGVVVLGLSGPAAGEPEAGPRPSITVTLGAAEMRMWPSTLEASGAVAAWQEVILAAQIGGLRLTEVRVNVGDRVRRGQVLAVFDAAAPRAEAARLEAALAQAVAAARRGDADFDRARSLAGSGALSDQEVLRYATEAESARAGVQAARAALDAAREQLRYVVVRAPDDGVIAARSATVGSVGGVGTELFRMIRQGRLEWRGELTAAQLARVSVGQWVELRLPDGSAARARVRQTAPALDESTRLGVVYADLVTPGSARAGMYARGTVMMPETPAVVAPARSVVLRDGRHYVYTTTRQGDLLATRAHQVTPGRRQDGEVELVQGAPVTPFVVDGAGFLKDGDLVRQTRRGAVPATPSRPPTGPSGDQAGAQAPAAGAGA